MRLGTQIRSENGKYIYHVSVIDYLQKYDLNKKLERYYKVIFNGAQPDELSSISCDRYKKRFMDFMKNTVFNYQNNHRLDSGIDLASKQFNIMDF